MLRKITGKLKINDFFVSHLHLESTQQYNVSTIFLFIIVEVIFIIGDLNPNYGIQLSRFLKWLYSAIFRQKGKNLNFYKSFCFRIVFQGHG